MKKQRIICRRQDFIDCVNGDLLIAKRGIVTHLGDSATKAVEAAGKGAPVYLTVDGVIVFVIKDFQEIPLQASWCKPRENYE